MHYIKLFPHARLSAALDLSTAIYSSQPRVASCHSENVCPTNLNKEDAGGYTVLAYRGNVFSTVFIYSFVYMQMFPVIHIVNIRSLQFSSTLHI